MSLPATGAFRKPPAQARTLVVLLAVALAVPAGASAATFSVNRTGDESDASLGDAPNACDVAPGELGDQCTLRAAIEEANFTMGADDVHFSFPGEEPRTIAPDAVLPTISGPVVIDGLTQPGAAANTKPAPKRLDAELRIVVSGRELTGLSDAFDVLGGAGGTTIRGLVINRFPGTGIIARAPTTVQGNFIGTNAAGTRARPIGFDGVFGFSGQSVIGGTSPEDRNLISGNGRAGIVTSPGLIAQGNLIGTTVDGRSPLGNTEDGLQLYSAGNKIGGPEAPNVIAHNGTDGIALYNLNTGSLFSANRIYGNDDLAIDLGNDGKTANDELDADTGPNGRQNFPLLRSARNRSGETRIRGELSSAASSTYVIEFFSNSSRAREGMRYLGDKEVTTDAAGEVSFAFRPERKVEQGRSVAATATAPDESTSEFSQARPVKAG